MCSSNVVQQFARVAQRVGFIYCFSILEANRRSEYSPDAKSRRGAGALTTAMRQSFDADLTTFFPFDPFKLPRSSMYIDGIYREWSSVAIDDSEDEDEEESEEEDGKDEYEYEDDEEVGPGNGLPTHRSKDEDLYMHGPASFADDKDDGLGVTFGGMSISPSQPQRVAIA